jgi:hypothetical protein
LRIKNENGDNLHRYVENIYGFKNISIRLYLYKKQKKLKVEDGTFSDLIEKLLDEGMNPRFDNPLILN